MLFIGEVSGEDCGLIKYILAAITDNKLNDIMDSNKTAVILEEIHGQTITVIVRERDATSVANEKNRAKIDAGHSYVKKHRKAQRAIIGL
jgi:hypothetical protein